MEYHQQRFHDYSPVSIMLPGSAGGPGAADVLSGGPAGRRGPAGSGVSAWGGWAAGAVLVALLVFIVRATEKCFDRRLFNCEYCHSFIHLYPSRCNETISDIFDDIYV